MATTQWPRAARKCPADTLTQASIRISMGGGRLGRQDPTLGENLSAGRTNGPMSLSLRNSGFRGG